MVVTIFLKCDIIFSFVFYNCYIFAYKNFITTIFSVKMGLFKFIFSNVRWVFICLYLLPVSVLYDTCSFFKNWLILKAYSSPSQHEYKTMNIQKQINRWIKSGRKTKLCTSRTSVSILGAGCPVYKNSFYNIKVNLVDILEINKDKKIVKLEPLVTIRQLTSVLLPLGWTIPVVPGMDDLTIGDLVMGTGLDSSSHKYGLFHNTCVSFELVLSDGSLVKCSRNENSDLFYAVPWSYGTLGILTAVEIVLIPAYNFVRLRFKAYHNDTVAVKNFLKELENKKNDFVEGFMYTNNQCVVVTGKMTDQIEPNKLNEIGKWYKPWFFQHIKSYFTKGEGVEYVPLKDYYYRHTRSVYWELQNIIPFGNNVFFRLFFGWAVPPKLSFLKITQKKLVKNLYENQLIMLDLMVPAEKLNISLNTLDKKLGVYPIWLCPFKNFNTPGFVHSRSTLEEYYVNMGVYGIPKAYGYHSYDSIKEIENYLREIEGFRILYGDIHLSEDEFRQQFDHSLYDQMRKKLNCHEAFPTVFDKIKLMKNENFYEKKKRDCLF